MAISALQGGSRSTDDDHEDQVLLRELIQGNRTALEALYDRYGALVMGLVYRMLQDRQSAEDAVQESFVQVWRRASSYDPQRGTLRSWLLAIIHHRYVDILRGRTTRPRTVSWDPATLELLGSADSWLEVERHLTQETVRRALLQPSREQREAIEFAYFGGYTHVQIAERLGLPLGTVKGRIRMGLHRLRMALDGLDERVVTEESSASWQTERVPSTGVRSISFA
jgi:RNA polymerase sigma-70 factor (ECF subfamily)